MGREEDAILGLWSVGLGDLEESLDAVDLAMQQRRFAFVVGLGNDQR